MSGLLAFVLGAQLPLGDDNWTKEVDVSPKLGVRAGVVQGALAGWVSADYTFEQLTPQVSKPAGFDTGASAYRVRMLAHIGFEHPINPKLTVAARFGAGIDYQHGSYDYTLLGTRFTGSDGDTGYAFEFGGGLWWDAGNVQVGGELAVPIGHHSKPSMNGSIGFDWTSYDLDILVGARVPL